MQYTNVARCCARPHARAYASHGPRVGPRASRQLGTRLAGRVLFGCDFNL